jgi:hypothetical protein
LVQNTQNILSYEIGISKNNLWINRSPYKYEFMLYELLLKQHVSQLRVIQFYRHGRLVLNVCVISVDFNDANITLETCSEVKILQFLFTDHNNYKYYYRLVTS